MPRHATPEMLDKLAEGVAAVRCRRRREWGGIVDLGDMVGSLLRTSQAT